MEPVEQVVEEIRVTQREIEKVWETGYSPDGFVAATVNGSGAVVGLDLDPRIYRRRDTHALSQQILAAINEASAHAYRRVTEVAERLAPRGRHRP